MLNTDRLGQVFVSSYGTAAVVTVNEMAKALSKDKKHQLSLEYDVCMQRFHILGSSGMKPEQINKLFNSMEVILVSPKILNETDANGNILVELEEVKDEFKFRDFKGFNEKNYKDQKYASLVRHFGTIHGWAFLNNRWRAEHAFDMLMIGQKPNSMSKL